jgi:replicative DNA helicase
VREILENYEGGINAFMDPSKRKKGLSTGFIGLDEKTGGLHGGDLFILAARPSMGKTSLLLNIAYHVAVKLAQPVVIFSLEMSQSSLLTRMMCAAARVDCWRFQMGYLHADERKRLAIAAADLQDAPLHIDDSSATDPMSIRASLRRLDQRQKLGLVGIDYLQLMKPHSRHENRTQEVTALSRSMKILAKDLGVPVVVLSQLSRANETRQGAHRPQLSDLRESGAIEQDADLVAFIYREAVYKPMDESLVGKAELILAKARNGPIGKIDLVWLEQFTKFENRTTEEEGSV